MGERGARNEPATPDDIAAMARIVQRGHRGRRARLLDVAHDRPPRHRRRAGARHVRRRGRAVRASAARSAPSGTGVFELAPAGVMGEDLAAPDREMDWIVRLAEETGRPVTFALLQHDLDPDQWRKMLDLVAEAYDAWHPDPPAGRRPPARPAARAADLPRAARPSRRTARSSRCRSPRRWRGCATRRCGRASSPSRPTPTRAMAFIGLGLDRTFQLGDPPDYEPDPAGVDRRDRRAPGRRPVGPATTTCSSPTTATSSCSARCSATRSSPRTRSARWCCTRPPRSGSATAARTSARSATRRSRPTCSRTGCATGRAASGSRSSS